MNAVGMISWYFFINNYLRGADYVNATITTYFKSNPDKSYIY